MRIYISTQTICGVWNVYNNGTQLLVHSDGNNDKKNCQEFMYVFIWYIKESSLNINSTHMMKKKEEEKITPSIGNTTINEWIIYIYKDIQYVGCLEWAREKIGLYGWCALNFNTHVKPLRVEYGVLLYIVHCVYVISSSNFTQGTWTNISHVTLYTS